jgi:hypothetical protein
MISRTSRSVLGGKGDLHLEEEKSPTMVMGQRWITESEYPP